ncbi:hypothetical protein [Niallia sp. FSL R7-0271]|uniref:hypothetical protein n=1 Tax=Niallia sp. FSL R7-0271 TaxID=2921678 RepID=UPI0030F96858
MLLNTILYGIYHIKKGYSVNLRLVSSVRCLPKETGIPISKTGIEVVGSLPAFLFKGEEKVIVQPKSFI